MSSSILVLPDEVLDNVLSYIPYDEISRLRLVSKRFDAACQRVLNQGFYKVEKYHARCLRRVKEQLPRRESERRKHPLAGHCDILTAIETRLSLLGMTFMKYVDLKYCCFIPGKVLDEIFKILRHISNAPASPRSHEILQELRDISSMAMEHFDEKIAPAFRNRRNSTPKLSITSNGALTGTPRSARCAYVCSGTQPTNRSSNYYGSAGTSTFRSPTATHELVKINFGYRQLQSKYSELKRENIECRRRLLDYRKKLHELDRKLSEQNAFILEQSNRISEQDGKISELNRKFMEFDKNMADTIIDLKHDEESSATDDDDDCNVYFDGSNVYGDDKVPPSSTVVSLAPLVQPSPPAKEGLEPSLLKLKHKALPSSTGQEEEETPSTLPAEKNAAAPPLLCKKRDETRKSLPSKRRNESSTEPQKKRMRASENRQ